MSPGRPTDRSSRWRRPWPRPREAAPADPEAALEDVRPPSRRSPTTSRDGPGTPTTPPSRSSRPALIARDRDCTRPPASSWPPAARPTRSLPRSTSMPRSSGARRLLRRAGHRPARRRVTGDRRRVGKPAPGVPSFTEPSVIVAGDLAPAETATLDRSLVVGIITQAGGRTSHTAILAAQMGIPAVVQCPAATEIPVGTRVAVDGDSGEVTPPRRVSSSTVCASVGSVAPRHRRRRRGGAPRDGFHVALLANIGGIKGRRGGRAPGPRGRGTLPDQFVFLSSDKAPTVEQQTDIYSRCSPFPGRRVVVRTLDAGADNRSPSPTSGRRRTLPSVGAACACRPNARTCSMPNSRPCRAMKATGADVRVMAPMVATAEEADWFSGACGMACQGRRHDRGAGAALRTEHVLRDCDFGSLGTNDLAQYTMAADRMQGELSDLLDRGSPPSSMSSRRPATVRPRSANRWVSAARPAVTTAGARARRSRRAVAVDGAEQGADGPLRTVAALARRVQGIAATHWRPHGPRGDAGSPGVVHDDLRALV